jgi:ubiquinone/menaquinone biosynthesis C-methylase UbiE
MAGNGELEYHERLYSGFAQRHFARAAVRALREHMVRRIAAATGAGPYSRVLSLGCGIGDTELLLAPRVAEVVGVDFSPAAIRQAREDAARAAVQNARFIEGPAESAPDAPYDAVVAIFFLHHLPDDDLRALPAQVRRLLKPGGVFYSLDPSRHRLSGAVGNLLIPGLMRKYQSPGERELRRSETAALFEGANFACRSGYYDFVSSPLAGLFPGWAWGYRAARLVDEALIRLPGVRALGSNFELIARA